MLHESRPEDQEELSDIAAHDEAVATWIDSEIHDPVLAAILALGDDPHPVGSTKLKGGMGAGSG